MRTASLEARVHARILAEVAPGTDVEHALVERLVRDEEPLLPATSLDAVVRSVLSDVRGLGPLDPVLELPGVTDVMINGPGPVWVEQAGRLRALDVALDRATIERLVERVVGPLGLRADRSSPLVDARLPDGSRVNVVMPPLAVDGPVMTIRRFGARTLPIDAFCDGPLAATLGDAVAARRNVLVVGGTGSGKTTLLNALAARIPRDERIVTVEDAAELRLPHDHLVRLEARPANAEGVGEIRIRDLVRNALRMRPDRIVVGEVRGAEALDMLQAMNTGHDGSLSTLHANTTADGLRRLETMVLMADVGLPVDAIREQIASAIDLVVHLKRESDGARRICEVASLDASGLHRVWPR